MFSAPKGISPTFYSTPTIFITHDAARFMHKLVDKVSMEVGWFMVTNETDKGDFILSECVVPGQECNGATTELTAEGQSSLLMEIMAEDDVKGIQISDPGYRANHLNCWMHSHATMPTNPSGQDDKQMVDFCQNYGDDYPFWIRGIVNKSGDAHFSVYYRCSKSWKVVTGCPVELIWPEEDGDLDSQVSDIVKERVKRLSAGGSYTAGKYKYGKNGYQQPLGKGYTVKDRRRFVGV